MPFNMGVPELLILLVIILLVFGVGRLPEVGGALGKSIREFRKATDAPEEAAVKKDATSELDERPVTKA